METVRIQTESAQQQQWKMLARLAYGRNIVTDYESRHGTRPDDALIEFVAGCMRQADVYFQMTSASPLDVSPLLLYYGATALMSGAKCLLRGKVPTIADHGAKLLVKRPVDTLGGVEIRPRNPHLGALQQFADEFSPGSKLTNGSVWQLEEIWASIPDIRREFLACYSSPPFTIPVEVVGSQVAEFERIQPEDLSRYPSIENVLDMIPGLSRAYLSPQYGDNMTHLVLRRRIGAEDIGMYSVFGDKYLQLAHTKKGARLIPSQEVLMFVGLFALGQLCRYYPDLWNPFVRADDTGERLLVESFLSVCHRYLPNLILNHLEKQRIQFVS